MAESAVALLLNHLTIFLQEESKLLGGIKEEAECIRDELERMRAFLRVADVMEESDPELQVWVNQVRDVAYDTEDVLDEFVLRLSRHREDGFYGFLRKISFSIKNLKARHRIDSEIKRIRSRVNQIAKGHQRYRYKFNISEQVSSSNRVNDNTWYDRRSDALLMEEAELVGIERPKKQLIESLVEENPRLKVVSVVGMGGLGKTTLIKKVYDDREVKGHFEIHAWITVSQSFELRELLKDLIQQLFGETKQSVPQMLETMDINNLKAQIKDFLQASRYLLILDDVWSINAWDALKYALPDNNCGSRILLTTRISTKASTSCVESYGNIYTMKPLSPEESWTLFCRKTFQGNCCPLHLDKFARSILKKCEGLPLAVVAISGVLATKDKIRVHEWELVLRSLGSQLVGNDKLESMEKILSLSYNDLPCYLKICFLYLGIFPEDYKIECMRLIRLWTAEGFVKLREGMTVEEVAEGYLDELLNRSLVQVAEVYHDGRLRRCRVHDLFREIITSKSREQRIAVTVGGGSTRWLEKVRRLSMHYTLGNLQQINCYSQLRSLLLFRVSEPLSKSSMPMLFNGGVRLLKVLELRGASIETLPNEVVKLYHLRYLSLRGTKVKMLPNSIGKLENLETLDLKDTYVNELPVQILKLQQLHHLLVYRYSVEDFLPFYHSYGFKAIVGIEGLSSLQKLSHIEVNDDNGRIVVGELGRLTQLRRLGFRKLRREYGMALCSSLQKLSNLQSLSIGSVEEDEIVDIQTLFSPPRFLQRLYLKGCLEKLPHWITSLNNLVRLRLSSSKLRDDPLQCLQDLTNLVEIELIRAYEGEELCITATGFQKLKRLQLAKLEGLRWVRVEKGSMPHLEELICEDCKLVEEVPTGIEHLANLKSFNLYGMSDKLIMTLNREAESGDYWKIAHIPNVWIGTFLHDCWKGYSL
ncbi:disease resistance protein RPM1-like [Cornus florida]|uniref:disease resistance protein RPM1-like n=1 Tax=Cornus florida TaxID=4283 RepID=UPI0028A0D230|nr:disease resistance protein RPM1-like [Cornus florida]